jgi:hypothetical protein
MQPNPASARKARRAFNPAKQLVSNTAAAPLRGYFDGLNIGSHFIRLAIPFNNRKASHLPILFRHPRRRIRAADKPSHHPEAKAKGWLKAKFFEGIEPVEVLRYVRAIQHSPNLRRAESKSHPRNEDGFLRIANELKARP